jgi:hypothetical protein
MLFGKSDKIIRGLLPLVVTVARLKKIRAIDLGMTKSYSKT